VPHDFWRVSEDRLRRALSLLPNGHGADFVHLFTNDVW
jgi:hypothetical protein